MEMLEILLDAEALYGDQKIMIIVIMMIVLAEFMGIDIITGKIKKFEQSLNYHNFI